MSGMAEVIAAHIPIGFWEAPDNEMDSSFCECGYEAEAMGKAKNFHAAHLAAELTKAGYGNVQEANTLTIEIPAEPTSGAVLDYTYSPFGNDSDEDPEWHRTMDGDWKGYKDGGKEYLSWPELVRRWGPLTEKTI